MKINETNPRKNFLPYMPHFAEADQMVLLNGKRKGNEKQQNRCQQQNERD